MESAEVFIISECNKKAYDMFHSIISEDKRGCFLALSGPNLCGKTHLSKIMQSQYKEQFPHRRVGYTDYDSILMRSYSSPDWEYETSFYEEICGYDLLVIDNMQFAAGMKSTQQFYASIINEALDCGVNVVVAFDCPVGHLKTFLDDIYSEENLGVVEIGVADTGLKRKYLNKLKVDIDVELPMTVEKILVLSEEIKLSTIKGYILKIKANQEQEELSELGYLSLLKQYLYLVE